jgi:lipid A 3-O-deacylase
VRAGFVPWGAVGPGVLRGALEVGLEPFYQRYTDPVDAYFAGLALVGRYHFLSLGRVVPYAELFAAAGGTNLRVVEIDSDFTFLLQGGLGLSVFVTDYVAVYGGYRFQHVSNGNTELPNRGFESHTGVAGVSWYFK